jgi:citrate lyase beta subunit
VTSLTGQELDPLLQRLLNSNQQFDGAYPGLQIKRQPVHTLYGGANLYKPGATQKMADLALRHVNTYAPTFFELAVGMGFPGAETLTVDSEADQGIARTVYDRMLHKLETEAVEDHRVDFEDGYGVRSDQEEDQHAIAAAQSMAQGYNEGSLPPFVGIRIKALTEEAKYRSIRTLDIFVSCLSEQLDGNLPHPFRVTLPKVTTPEQVAVLADCLSLLEKKCGLSTASIDIELMIETVQSVFSQAGGCAIPTLVQAGKGRVTAAILGTFDYTATCNIASTHQDHLHPAAEFARQLMQVSLTGTDVALCDGITNIMPIAPHRGEDLSPEAQQQNVDVVYAAWRVHFRNIMHSLRLGFYQSWDLNPAQLPVRYAAVYYFFLEGLSEATDRLKTFIDQAAQASMVDNTFDDAASAQGLLNFFISGINCGAISENEALATGITLAELHERSFLNIVANRTNAETTG